MRYHKLGSTGLDVSVICLGCMSFGDRGAGGHQWTLDEPASVGILKQALDAGINFLDTANTYSAGTSEEFVGRALKSLGADRDNLVIATKVFMPMRPGPNGGGLSRKAILAEIDHSLRRLQLDYVDLYQIHRWDSTVPVEETMESLHDVVKAGKARYIGASSMYAWQFAKAQHVAERSGWTRFVTMQNHYNLIYREEEREMFPLLADQGVASIPWSPLARGRLTRPWDDQTERAQTDQGQGLYQPGDRQIVDRVTALAEKRGLTPAQVALAWVMRNPVVSAPIVGATAPKHLQDALAAIDVELTDADATGLEEPYAPHLVAGHS
jgi:aryl-alcohol dehydrogenase-like predicted oxidoreductase